MSGPTPAATTSQRSRPPRRERAQRRALARQAAHGQDLTGWLQDRRVAADKARATLREKAAAAAKKAGTTVRELFGRRHPAAEPRDRDRGLRSPLASVPGRRELMTRPTVVVEHTGPNHAARRVRSAMAEREDARQVTRTARVTGPMEQAELGKPRSRALARRGRRRVTLPSGNQPYRNPGRAEKLARAGRLRADVGDAGTTGGGRQ